MYNSKFIKQNTTMLKKILFGMTVLALFSACKGEYTDWAEPQNNPEVPAVDVNWAVTAAQSDVITLDNVDTDVIKLINVVLPEGVSSESYNVKLTAEDANYEDYNITADANGNVSVGDLQRATTEMFNIMAVERIFNAVVSTDVLVKGKEGLASVRMASEPLIIKVIPKTPQFNPFVYFIGATDGWSASDQRLSSDTGDGKYTGFIFIADPNGWGLEFKFQKIAGDWGDNSQLNSNNMNSVTGDFEKTGDNFKAIAGEGIYFVELDLSAGTLKGTRIYNMNLVGDFNGWNAGDDAQQMTWDSDNYCYIITGAGVTANGWKFTANNSWDINLGGDALNNLVANGANITAVGSTIKLYPTRKTSDKIYCTVE